MNNCTLVLGASLKAERYSNMAIQKLVAHKVPTKAVGLRLGEVAGVKIQTGKPLFDGVETVTLYLNPKRQKDYYSYIIALKPKRVIFNPGTENAELMDLLKQNNIAFEVACTLTLLATNQF
jgi:predicted CoA-binding protein